MALSPFSKMPFSWVYTSLFFLIFTNIRHTNSSSTPTTSVSYPDYCSSFVPESSPTSHILRRSLPNLITPYLTGGDKLLGVKQQNQSFYYSGKFLRLRVPPTYQKTIADGVYKVEGFLSIRSPYQYYGNVTDGDNPGYAYAGSYYHKSSRARGSIRFRLTGFWSEISRKLCMVGSAVDGITTVDLDVVLKVNFASEKPDIYTGVVSGTLESISTVVNDPAYFDPIFIFQFSQLSNYNYSLASGDSGGGLVSEVVKKEQPLGLQPSNNLCSMSVLELEYDGTGSQSGLLSSRFLAVNPIQCSGDGKKLRFLARLQNMSYVDQTFDLESTLIGEASWDDEKNELSGVVCRLLNPSDNPEHAVGDCTMTLSLKYNTIWTLKNEPKAIGQFWSTKKADDSMYFNKVKLTSLDPVTLPDLRYDYSELVRAKKICPVKKPAKKWNIYPDGHSYDMRFDMSVKNSKGEEIAWGYANPISVGNDLFDRNIMFAGEYSTVQSASAPISFSVPVRSTYSTPTNISYKITIHSPKKKFVKMFPNLNLSTELLHGLDITAEGVYSSENGYLCMVGCGKLTTYGRNSNHVSTDCKILVKFQFASLNDKKGGYIKGTVESTRNKSDPLRFEDMGLSSAAYYAEVSERSIWRTDLEITLVLISNTLLCVFIGLQIFHVKRNPEVVSRISLVMLVILCLGHMIPLVLNFEAVFLGSRNKQTLFVSSDGWLEANEVAVRVITMVAFLLQIRLVQIVWTAKQNEGNEKKSVFVLLPLYIFGCLFALLLNWARDRKNSLWGDLRSYAGLILDGFLFPQIVLNVFGGGSAEKALARSFYVGTSAVRLVPHAYNQYRAHNYPAVGMNGTYYYANPGADFYSTAWDVLIPCGVIALAVIVFLQQRNGGRWILPQRFRELELYEKVPTVVNE